MGRHERRSAITFRQRAGNHLVTFLTDDVELIDGNPALKSALAHWLAVVELRRPICIGCRSCFMDGAQPAAYLFASSPAIPNAASTSAFCVECWVKLDMDEVEAICTRVLRRLLPRGAFAPMGAP
jgi:hypothetical protein